MESLPVIILGAENMGKVALEVIQSTDIVVYCFLDDNYSPDESKEVNHVSVMGKTDDEDMLSLIGEKCDAFVATHNAKERKKLSRKVHKECKKYPITFTHKAAYLADDVTHGWGNLFGMGVMIGANATIGNSCIVGANTTLDFDVKVGSFSQIGIGTNIGSGVEIAEEVFVGNGVTIIAGIKIGKGATIGAGSVVMANVEAGQTVLGNPAKPVKI